jgi:hypothetical protein
MFELRGRWQDKISVVSGIGLKLFQHHREEVGRRSPASTAFWSGTTAAGLQL